MKLVKTIALSTILAGTVIPSAQAGSIASYYSDAFNGRRMANGQRFHQNSNSVASNKYKLGTVLKICHRSKCVTGVVRDRCGCSGVDLSKGLFRQLAPLKKGRIPVKIYR